MTEREQAAEWLQKKAKRYANEWNTREADELMKIAALLREEYQVAADNAVLNSRLAELQGRYFAAVKNNEALMAERDKLAAENAEAYYRGRSDEKMAWSYEVKVLTAERDELREAVDNFFAWADDNSFYERLTFDEAVQKLRNARKNK